jgi:hypothetical protein
MGWFAGSAALDDAGEDRRGDIEHPHIEVGHLFDRELADRAGEDAFDQRLFGSGVLTDGQPQGSHAGLRRQAAGGVADLAVIAEVTGEAYPQLAELFEIGVAQLVEPVGAIDAPPARRRARLGRVAAEVTEVQRAIERDAPLHRGRHRGPTGAPGVAPNRPAMASGGVGAACAGYGARRTATT